jgi:uncharacterized protein YegJ (DUF2314 family)
MVSCKWRWLSGIFVFIFGASLNACSAQNQNAFPEGPVTSEYIHFEFAVYYLDSSPTSPIESFKSNLAKQNLALKIVDTLPAEPKTAFVTVKLDTEAQKDYSPPTLKMLQYFGRGLSAEQVQKVRQSNTALILDFAHPQELAFTALRNEQEIVEKVARDTGGLIWDQETRELFTPDAWSERRLNTWENGIPEISKHIVIHAYSGDKLVREITLGMAKFGLPDIVVNDFPWAVNDAVGNLIDVFAQKMAEGISVSKSGRFDLDLHSIKNKNARDAQLDNMKSNAAAVAKLTLVKGKWEKGDPENRLLEIEPDQYSGPDRYAQLNSLLSQLFGTEDSIKYVKHDKELLDASDAAKAKLPKLQREFQQGLKPGEYILVSAPFTTTSGGREWMWVEVTKWNGDSIEGLLEGEPDQVPNLKAGQMVKVSQSDVFDYLHHYPNGQSEGNETSKIIEKTGKEK